MLSYLPVLMDPYHSHHCLKFNLFPSFPQRLQAQTEKEQRRAEKKKQERLARQEAERQRLAELEEFERKLQEERALKKQQEDERKAAKRKAKAEKLAREQREKEELEAKKAAELAAKEAEAQRQKQEELERLKADAAEAARLAAERKAQKEAELNAEKERLSREVDELEKVNMSIGCLLIWLCVGGCSGYCRHGEGPEGDLLTMELTIRTCSRWDVSHRPSRMLYEPQVQMARSYNGPYDEGVWNYIFILHYIIFEYFLT